MTVAEYNEALRRIEARVSAALKAGEPKKKVNDIRLELEFELLINFRLGETFPKDRREALLLVHRALRKDLKAAVGRHVRGEVSAEEHAFSVNSLVRRSIEEYSRVLSPPELEAFVGCGPDDYVDIVNPGMISPHPV
ncbi:hypothetical protein SAMN05444166_0154 [Singulisphaera sp. GP187]|nr:hypothetical protein SAMN05444166_0154 [Singulisphaera sp. GP187]